MNTSYDYEELAKNIDLVVEQGGMGFLTQIVLSLFAISFGLIAILFFLRAFAVARINRRLGNRGIALLAFIPGLSGYALGTVADALKRRKPSNYCIHQLMLRTFHLGVSVVYYALNAQRLLDFRAALESGAGDTLSLLEQFMEITPADHTIYLVYMLFSILGLLVSLVDLLCYSRILTLFRSRHALLLLMLSIFIPESMTLYLLAARNKRIYMQPPVIFVTGDPNFRPGNGTDQGGQDGTDDSGDSGSGNDEPRDDA